MRFYPFKWFAQMVVVVSLFCAMVSFAVAAEAPKPAVSDYQIGPGDVVEISVWKNPDLTRTVAVLPDGKISFPLLGPIPAAGKTVSQLSADLRKQLSRYAPDVDLSVIVVQVNSMLIYVIRKVQKPDRFELNANVTVIQTLAIAGGLKKLRERPILSFTTCPVSPLQLIKECCEIIIESARSGSIVNILSMAMAGGTSPVTLAGTAR